MGWPPSFYVIGIEPKFEGWRTQGRWLGNLGLVVVNTIYNNRTGQGQRQNGLGTTTELVWDKNRTGTRINKKGGR